MNKKYELLRYDSIEVYGRKLYRIRALKSFGKVKKGYLGGYIESESNLSHYNTCWVFDEAQVHNKAQVRGKARVRDNALVSGNARVSGKAEVFGDAWVSGKAWVSGNDRVFEGELK